MQHCTLPSLELQRALEQADRPEVLQAVDLYDSTLCALCSSTQSQRRSRACSKERAEAIVNAFAQRNQR